MKEARLWGAGGDPSSVMQHGGSQYGAPPPDHMAPFAPGTSAQQQPQPLAEAASPISSRAPPRAGGLEELPPGAPGGFPDEDALVAAAGEEAAERGGAPGNRWPRQETLALLKIRSEMDAVFRDATLKAPLWEDVSRKLAELGYKRSAKKCKEKFENVHKYYKRTKDGRAGRQDGKSYRFFSQLEALHSSGGAAPAPATGSTAPNTVTSSLGMVGSSSGPLQPTPLNTIPPAVGTAHRGVSDPPMAAVSGPSGGISFSVTSSSSASESEEDTEEGLTGQPRKRKRRGGSGSGRKMMTFFEELMRQVMERQEAMQQRFLEAIEKREQDRMIREEAWKRQEVARLSREHDMMTQERAMSASRDAAIIAFLQKITGQTIPVPEAATPRPQPPSQLYPPPAPVSPPPPEQTRPPPPQRSQGQQPQPQVPPETAPVLRTQASTLDIVPASETLEVVASGAGGSGMDPASSRWPKSEVHALIKLRSELEARYQDAGPKGPLWEEVATRMQRMGYNRSAKRCKEKWENINKYFKKVKESNKKRPEDSKTCPYFHQLDALYRRKLVGSGGGVAESSSSDRPKQQALVADDPHKQPPPPQQAETEGEGDGGGGGSNNSNGGGNPGRNGGSSSSGQKIQTSNGGLKPGISFDEGVGGGGSAKKPEDTVKEYLMDQPQQRRQHQAIMMGADYDKSDELDTDEDVDEDEEDQGMHYRIHYQQKAGVNATSSNGAAAAGSFMAMMQ